MKCMKCGKPSGLGMTLCKEHAQTSFDELGNAVAPESVLPEDPPLREGAVGLFFCFALGLILSLGGIYFMLVQPGYGETVNLQRLVLGQTGTLAGAIFLAAGIRPLRR